MSDTDEDNDNYSEEENDEPITSDEEEESDESISEEDILNESAGEEDFDEFEQGLSLSNRFKVKQARKLYFDEKQQEYNSKISNEVSQRIKEKWTDILDTVGEQSAFDFNILKSLVTNTNNNQSTFNSTQEQLDIKQQGDDWDYTIGLKKEIEKSLNDQVELVEEEKSDDDDTDDDDDVEDEGITDDDDD